MSEYAYGLYEYIAGETSSELIFFFIIVAVLVVPLYGFMIKDRKYSRQHESDKHAKYIEREREIIGVVRDVSGAIKENSAVIGSLKSLLEHGSADTRKSIERVHGRLDVALQGIARIEVLIAGKFNENA